MSPDPLTALHCIRGSVLAGGDGDTGRLYFSILSCSWVSFSFISSGHLALCFWILLYIFLCNKVTFFLLLSLLSSSCFLACCWSVGSILSCLAQSVGSLSCLAQPVLFVLFSSVSQFYLSGSWPKEKPFFLNIREKRRKNATTIFLPGCSRMR